MRKILTSFALVATSLAFAQVGINADETNIANDAVFHVKNKTGEVKGVILPTASLTSETDQGTITGGIVTTGLMVWNDGKKDLKPAGYYYWDGAKWVLTGNVNNAVSVRTDTGGTVTITEADDYVRMTGNVSTINMPTPSASNKGKRICIYNEGAGAGNFSPIGVGPQGAALPASNASCYVSDGADWISFSGY